MRLFKRLLVGILIVLVIAIPAVAIINRQSIYDWIRLQGYEPPAEIVELASKNDMTEHGRKTFYINRPQILDDKAEFSNACEQTEQSIVLGCYINNTGIYLYRVKDKRLSGVVEVTAAHEMLHAAYDRLPQAERARIDALLQDAFKKVSSQRIKETVARYEKRDPSVVPSELHSILGTEVQNLPAELEAYYQQYFTDRSTVVAYSERYEAEFGNRQKQVEEYDDKLSAMKTTIETQQADIEQLSVALTQERKRVESLSGTPSYALAASAYNKKVAEYNVRVREAQNIIDEYNELVKARNALAVEVQGLVDAIDSRPETL